LKDSDDPNETPYMATTVGFPLYKGSYGVSMTPKGQPPPGFYHNQGDQFIHYPIKATHEDEMKQAQYVQTIMGPNPLVIGLRDNTNKVYSTPLYTAPIYHFNSKLVYMVQELEVLKTDVEECNCMDHMLHHLHNPSLTIEVHQFCVLTNELNHMEEVLVSNKEQWGHLAAAKLGAIRRLEMADANKRINANNQGFVDDALRINEAILHGRKG